MPVGNGLTAASVKRERGIDNAANLQNNIKPDVFRLVWF
jgi:hypothetical protein